MWMFESHGRLTSSGVCWQQCDIYPIENILHESLQCIVICIGGVWENTSYCMYAWWWCHSYDVMSIATQHKYVHVWRTKIVFFDECAVCKVSFRWTPIPTSLYYQGNMSLLYISWSALEGWQNWFIYFFLSIIILWIYHWIALNSHGLCT